MENPNRSFRHSLAMIAFGILIGAIPGLIHVDQMRRELQAETAEAQKLSVEARKQITEALADAQQAKAETDEAKKQIGAQHADCQNAILGDGGRTILLDLNHPYGSPVQQLLGASLTLPPAGNRAMPTGPIWVVPRTITPHVVDGVLGAAYTHIWPDGHTDGWKAPTMAE